MNKLCYLRACESGGILFAQNNGCYRSKSCAIRMCYVSGGSLFAIKMDAVLMHCSSWTEPRNLMLKAKCICACLCASSHIKRQTADI